MESQNMNLTSKNRLNIDIMEISSSCVIIICDERVKVEHCKRVAPFGESRIGRTGKVKQMQRKERRGRNFEQVFLNSNKYRTINI